MNRQTFLEQLLRSSGVPEAALSGVLETLQDPEMLGLLQAGADEAALLEPGWPLEQLAGYWARNGRVALTFDDITLEQDHSDVVSRSEPDTGVLLAPDLQLKGFLVTAPMPDVTWFDMARAMAKLGMLGCVHRIPMADWWITPGMRREEAQRRLASLTREEIELMVIRMTVEGFADFIQSGHTPDQVVMSISHRTFLAGHADRLWEVAERHGRMHVLIETANGDSTMVTETTAALRKRFDDKVIIGGGNFTTGHAMVRAAEAGMNWGRMTIGPGRQCRTRRVAGVGVPAITGIAQAAACLRAKGLLWRENGRGMAICQDGGTNALGDRVKGLCAGADISMAGTSMAICLESGAQHFEVDGKHFIHIRGNASAEVVQSVRPEDWRKIAAEGGVTTTPVDPANPVTAADYWFQAKSALGSTCGYWGAHSIAELRTKHRAWRVTSAGLSEGKDVAANGTSKVRHF
ncbi:MAG: hypothetical protein CO132_05290 [Candidatus Kerfeldbacteria bacterium CG_4_9_14_3_um_filter_45_8]|nr:MAG: hypothetical protein CO132_05290 [Candidatus Kerfeldbacteria bacterium CG_4_9_14_3_um_filter_45_8]